MLEVYLRILKISSSHPDSPRAALSAAGAVYFMGSAEESWKKSPAGGHRIFPGLS